MTGVTGLFRLHGAARRDPAVDAWLIDGPLELRSIAQEWFSAMRNCGSDVRELLHDGHPTACVEDAAFGYVNVYNDHVNVGFFYGAGLKDESRLLEGSGKRMRHVKVKPGREFNDAALRDLVDAAYADIRARIDGERSWQ
jgi:hypothetical protein